MKSYCSISSTDRIDNNNTSLYRLYNNNPWRHNPIVSRCGSVLDHFIQNCYGTLQAYSTTFTKPMWDPPAKIPEGIKAIQYRFTFSANTNVTTAAKLNEIGENLIYTLYEAFHQK